ncbi:pyridoxal-phosphate dependent enzyme [Brachybacterium muris]|uniref:pyridoxal-phosphate dependent enzyme n=1 Tax=Brachybacterium muris TaxID=219301 RepID=UPI0023EE77B6|nr:pyridoxal-phosphate dependent enzyme [Brachybacterium muris]
MTSNDADRAFPSPSTAAPASHGSRPWARRRTAVRSAQHAAGATGTADTTGTAGTTRAAGEAAAPAAAFHRSLPGYAPTPLLPATGLAQRWGVGEVLVKDESARLGLPAFKILGASWAVAHAVPAAAGHGPAGYWEELQETAAGSGLTLVTATDGNHGRALAHLARMLGIHARIYTPDGVGAPALEAIRSEGAELVEHGGVYDEAVQAAADSIGEGELLVQDTAWDGYEQIPALINEGYGTLFAEIDDALAGAEGGPLASRDLLVVPTGVGSLLQAALTHARTAADGPRVLAVEPVTAACATASLAAGEPVAVPADVVTSMAGLTCGTLSDLAWPAIRDGLDAGIGVTDEETARAIEQLEADGVRSGPCGAASAAAITAMLGCPDPLELGADSRIVLLSTEGR